MKTLASDQVLTQINEFYHSDFQQHTRTLLQPDEIIAWAGNQSPVEGRLASSGAGRVGYLLITRYRIIQVDFLVYTGIFGRDRFRVGPGYFAVSSPTRRLSNGEKKRRRVREIQLRNITDVNRNDYETRIWGARATFVHLEVVVPSREWLDFGFYSLEDGQEVYQFLQHEIHKEPTRGQEGFIEELERLAALHKSGALTAAEFQAAKQKLIGG